MSKKINHLLIALTALLAIGAVAIFLFSLNLNNSRYENGSNVVRKIQQLDSSWSMEAVKVRSNPQSDFDGLASFLPRLESLKSELNEILITDNTLPERFANSITGFIKQLEAKEEKVERFKTGFAVIRNSERYLPLAARSVNLAAQSSGLPYVGGTATVLVEDINAYMRSPNDAERKRISSEMSNLSSSINGFPAKLASEVAGFLSHGEVLMENTLRTEQLLTEATSDKSVSKAEDLVSGFSSMATSIEAQKSKLQYIAIGALVLAALLGLLLSMRKAQVTQPADKKAKAHAGGTAEAAHSLNSSDTSYRVFAGLIVKDIIQSLSKVNMSLDQVRQNANGVSMAFARAQNVVGNMERGLLPQDKAIAELKSDLVVAASESSPEAINSAIAELNNDYQSVLKAVKKISDFAGTDNEAEYEWININDIVREIVFPANYNNQAQIDIRLGDVPHLYASPDEIRYMFQNIVDNAVDAIKASGKVDGCIKVETQVADSNIGITITDNGVGMTQEKRTSLLQLFKPENLGKLDLGFPAANYIVKKYGGRILLNSMPEKGTAVRVILPESEQAMA